MCDLLSCACTRVYIFNAIEGRSFILLNIYWNNNKVEWNKKNKEKKLHQFRLVILSNTIHDTHTHTNPIHIHWNSVKIYFYAVSKYINVIATNRRKRRNREKCAHMKNNEIKNIVLFSSIFNVFFWYRLF